MSTFSHLPKPPIPTKNGPVHSNEWIWRDIGGFMGKK